MSLLARGPSSLDWQRSHRRGSGGARASEAFPLAVAKTRTDDTPLHGSMGYLHTSKNTRGQGTLERGSSVETGLLAELFSSAMPPSDSFSCRGSASRNQGFFDVVCLNEILQRQMERIAASALS